MIVEGVFAAVLAATLSVSRPAVVRAQTAILPNAQLVARQYSRNDLATGCCGYTEPTAAAFARPTADDAASIQLPSSSSLPYGSVFQVHTVNYSGQPALEYYEIDPSTASAVQDQYVFLDSTSNDFNASIAADSSGDAYLTWSATDPANNLAAMILFGGRQGSDPLNTVTVNPTPLATSSTCLTFDTPSQYYPPTPTTPTPQLWSDFSAVWIDPSDPNNLAWIVNEDIQGDATYNWWGTQIGELHK